MHLTDKDKLGLKWKDEKNFLGKWSLKASKSNCTHNW
jgi:hypothetical protein